MTDPQPPLVQFLPPSPYATQTRQPETNLMTGAAFPPGFGTALHLEVDFRATAARIYETLLDARAFTAFSGAEARIDPSEGGAFSLVGGRVTGRHVELVPPRRIVQAWHVVPWAAGVYSIVKFELQPTDAGTHLSLDHSGFAPEDIAARIAGWCRVYLNPIRKYLDG